MTTCYYCTKGKWIFLINTYIMQIRYVYIYFQWLWWHMKKLKFNTFRNKFNHLLCISPPAIICKKKPMRLFVLCSYFFYYLVQIISTWMRLQTQYDKIELLKILVYFFINFLPYWDYNKKNKLFVKLIFSTYTNLILQ